jgi:hypothetical protein
MKTLYATLSIASLLMCYSQAASVIINWSVTSDPTRNLENRVALPLSAGSSAVGDGTLVQLGYYSSATQVTPFSGTWVTLATTTMGDDTVDISGKFATTSTLVGGAFVAPAVGTPLAVRFFDGISVATSSHFNVVSDSSGGWNFVAPADPTPNINIVIDKTAGIVFQSGEVGAFQTRLAIPEPSLSLLIGVAATSLLFRRRKE